MLIYVFDITSTEWENDRGYFDDILKALRENSADAGVWVLVNKMDLMDKEDPKRRRYEERRAEVVAADEKLKSVKEGKGGLRCFPTSIWDESLYKVGSPPSECLFDSHRHGHLSFTPSFPISTSSHPISPSCETSVSVLKPSSLKPKPFWSSQSRVLHSIRTL